MTVREIKESPLIQGIDEAIVYTLTTTPWGSSPGSSAAKVFDITEGAKVDVTSTVMPSGSASESGDVITLPAMQSLTAGKTYRVEVSFVCSGNTFEAFAIVTGEE